MIRKQNAVRLILINPKQEFLFLRMLPPKTFCEKRTSPYWLMPGGRLEKDETLLAAAERELFEETGICKDQVKFGPIVFHGTFTIRIQGILTEIYQEFLIAHTTATDISLDHLMEDEKQVVHDYKWFSLKDIPLSKDPVYPIGIETHLPAILNKTYPEEPLELFF